jgi:hypothetical protein
MFIIVIVMNGLEVMKGQHLIGRIGRLPANGIGPAAEATSENPVKPGSYITGPKTVLATVS